MHENIELGTRYELNLNRIVDHSTRDAEFRRMIDITKEVYRRLHETPGIAEIPTAAEYRKNSKPSAENEERFTEFSQKLEALMAEYGIFEENELAAQAHGLLRKSAQDCDNAIDLNLEIEANLGLKETVSKKQLHKDYVQLRGLIFGMAPTLGYELPKGTQAALPAKSGNFGDDLPLVTAQAAFHDHQYALDVYEVEYDGYGRIYDVTEHSSHQYRPGVHPIRLAMHLGLMPLLTRGGFLSFMNGLTNRFGWSVEDFIAMDPDGDGDFVWYNGNKIYCLHVSPVGKNENEVAQ